METNIHFLHPSTLFVSDKPVCIITILGSCVSVCLYDPILKIGGMNHYMLPYWNGEGLASPKYGNIAIKKLVEELLKKGCSYYNLVAKVFGGGNIFQINNHTINIHQRNIEVARSMLADLEIPVISSSLGGNCGRKIQFYTGTGRVLHNFIINRNLKQLSE